MSAHAGALEAVDRILNRGGEADDVLRAVVAVLHERLDGRFVRIAAAAAGSLGADEPLTAFPIVLDGRRVADLEVGGRLDADDRAALERVAVVVSPYATVTPAR